MQKHLVLLLTLQNFVCPHALMAALRLALFQWNSLTVTLFTPFAPRLSAVGHCLSRHEACACKRMAEIHRIDQPA